MARVRRDANASKRDPKVAQGSLGEVRRKTLNNVGHPARDSSEGEDNCFVSYSGTTLPERYKRDEFRVHCHVNGGLHEFCAIFQHADVRASNLNASGRRIPPLSSPRSNSRLAADDLKQPMLVRIVYLMKQIEDIVATPTNVHRAEFALVWLQPLDNCLMVRSKAANIASASIFEAWPLASGPTDEEDWELGVACRCLGIQQCKLPNQAIQSRSQVMGNLPNGDAPIQVGGDIYAYAVHIFSGLRVELRPDNLIVGVTPEGFLGARERADFTFCTPYLEARAIQRMHDVYSGHGQGKAPQAANPKRTRNPRPAARRVPSQPQEDCEAPNSEASPEEVASQTEHDHPRGDCNATHTHLGSPEDA